VPAFHYPASRHEQDNLTERRSPAAEQLADFDRLLKTTTLPAVIATTTKVTDRLTLLYELNRLLFDADGKKAVRERDQLHEILANGQTWVFGGQGSGVL
jgi:hypothetical protein